MEMKMNDYKVMVVAIVAMFALAGSAMMVFAEDSDAEADVTLYLPQGSTYYFTPTYNPADMTSSISGEAGTNFELIQPDEVPSEILSKFGLTSDVKRTVGISVLSTATPGGYSEFTITGTKVIPGTDLTVTKTVLVHVMDSVGVSVNYGASNVTLP